MKQTIFIGLVLIALLLSGCVQESPTNEGTQQSSLETDSSIIQEEEQGKNPTKGPIVELCEAMPRSEFRDICYSRVAAARNDESYCRSMQNNDYICVHGVCSSNAQAYCFIQIADLRKDVSVCENIVDDKETLEDCYDFVAVSAGDATLCDKISSDYWKQRCYWKVALANDDLALCEEPGPTIPDECYRKIAMARKDPAVCKNIDKPTGLEGICQTGGEYLNEDLKAFCEGENGVTAFTFNLNQCYYFVAEEMNDLSACDVMQDEESKKECYKNVSKYARNKEQCDRMFSMFEFGDKETSTRRICYSAAAKNSKDVSVCKEVSGTSRETCEEDALAVITGSTVCKSDLLVSDEECYTLVAEAAKDPAICENIVGDKGACYAVSVSKIEHIPLCDNKICRTAQVLEEGRLVEKEICNENNACYHSIAVAEADISICSEKGDYCKRAAINVEPVSCPTTNPPVLFNECEMAAVNAEVTKNAIVDACNGCKFAAISADPLKYPVSVCETLEDLEYGGNYRTKCYEAFAEAAE